MRTTRTALAAAAMAAAALLTVPSPAAAAGCSGTAWAPPGFQWGPPSQGSVAYSGGPTFRKSYYWRVNGNIPSKVSVQAMGFENGHARWYSVGITNTGMTGAGSVPWGSNLAYPKLRVMSGNWTGANVTWTC